MKKLFALMLAAAMLLTCAAAFAEAQTMGTVAVNGEFEIRGPLPEGYEIEMQYSSGDMVLAGIANHSDPSAPAFVLAVAFDEMYSDVARLNDLDDEALRAIEATFAEEDNVDITYTQTAYGTLLMVIRGRTEQSDYVGFYTIYLGYSVEFAMVANDPAGLTDEQFGMAVQFLSDLEFAPVN